MVVIMIGKQVQDIAIEALVLLPLVFLHKKEALNNL